MAMSRADITDQLAKKTESLGYEWVGCDWSGSASNVTLSIFVDHADGINIDQCATVSRELSTLLDVLDAIPNRYTLEISSPGIQRPLFTPAHFAERVGQRVKVKLLAADDLGRRQFKGLIQSVEGNVICLALDDDELITVQHADIAKAALAADGSR